MKAVKRTGHVGFKSLTRQLASRRGKRAVSDPKALAAYIGRQKYGASVMAKKAAAGHRAASRKARPKAK